MENNPEPKPKGNKKTLVAIVAVVIVVIIIGSVVALDYNNLVKPSNSLSGTQYLAVYPGPNGTESSAHLLGGHVLAEAIGGTSANQAAAEAFMAYLMNPGVQYQYEVNTGFIPVDNYSYSSSGHQMTSIPTSPVNSSVTGTIYYFYDQTSADVPFITGVINDFQTMYPHVTVHSSNIAATSIVSSVEAEVNANHGETIVMSIDNLDIGTLYYGGYLLAMDSSMLKAIEPVGGMISSMNNLTDKMVTQFHGIYFLPQGVNIPLVWVNMNALNAAGIKTLPTNDTQLMSDAKALYKHYGVGMINFQGHGGASTATELYQWIVQMGGNPMMFNSTQDIHTFEFLYNLSPYFSPEYKTSYWKNYLGLSSNKYSMMDYQWPGSVNLTALGMNTSKTNSVLNVSLQAMNEGVFLRDPVQWISEWQNLIDNAWTQIIVDHGNYSKIPSILSSENSAMYNYLLSTYNYTTAQNYENGEYAPIAVSSAS